MKPLEVLVSKNNRQINAIEFNDATESFTVSLLANTEFTLAVPAGSKKVRFAIPIASTVWVGTSPGITFPAGGTSVNQDAEPNPGVRVIRPGIDTNLYLKSDVAIIFAVFFYLE